MRDDNHQGLEPSAETQNGSSLRILIVHTRWNSHIVQGLVDGAKKAMIEQHHVKPENIVIQSVPGAYELPFAAKKFLEVSQVRAAEGANDLMGNVNLLGDLNLTSPTGASVKSPPPSTGSASKQAFDAVICIGVLIKGSTMHFEYICEAVTQGIMRVGLDSGVPVIFGVLTCLNEEQALNRAGMDGKGHNHGLDWGSGAVEMALLKGRSF